jgi:hypothetical protein
MRLFEERGVKECVSERERTVSGQSLFYLRERFLTSLYQKFLPSLALNRRSTSTLASQSQHALPSVTTHTFSSAKPATALSPAQASALSQPQPVLGRIDLPSSSRARPYHILALVPSFFRFTLLFSANTQENRSRKSSSKWCVPSEVELGATVQGD